jgi:hypothetical protein
MHNNVLLSDKSLFFIIMKIIITYICTYNYVVITQWCAPCNYVSVRAYKYVKVGTFNHCSISLSITQSGYIYNYVKNLRNNEITQ